VDLVYDLNRIEARDLGLDAIAIELGASKPSKRPVEPLV